MPLQYTAPTDDALAYDIQAVPMFGLNMIRLHQKVNPERWYYHADKIGEWLNDSVQAHTISDDTLVSVNRPPGVVVLQDMVQKYGRASDATIPFFVEDFKAMVKGRGNHPCIVQFTTFNEADCWKVFDTPPYDVAGVVNLSRALDPTRLVDTDSGGGANDLHIADVNDVHSYPYPGDPAPSASQYAMVGEFGGIGAFVRGKEWKPASCHTYLPVALPSDEARVVAQVVAQAPPHEVRAWARLCCASALRESVLVRPSRACPALDGRRLTSQWMAEEAEAEQVAAEQALAAAMTTAPELRLRRRPPPRRPAWAWASVRASMRALGSPWQPPSSC